MSGSTVTRKLAAILAADVSGYSRMVATDEERTLRVLSGHRAALDRVLAEHSGRVVSAAGDSVLAEFGSAVQALRAAAAIQDVIRERNEDLAEAERLQFRIGVHLGDVVVDGDNLMGDGVNVAARLESLAPPGGICVSGAVYDQLAGKLDLRCRDLGHHVLKNIPRPVRVYEVVPGPPGRLGGWRLRLSKPSRALGAGVFLGVVLSVLVGALFVSLIRSDPGIYPADMAATPSESEQIFWDSVKQTDNPAELRAYLQRYPNGAFSALARARLEGLTIAENRRTAESEAMAKLRESELAQAEAARLKRAADLAIERAAVEQATANRLKREADAAAAKAAAAMKAATEAQQRVVRAAPVAKPTTFPVVATGIGGGSYDGHWWAERRCDATAQEPALVERTLIEIVDRQVVIEFGRLGLPGHFRVNGAIDEDGTLALKGRTIVRGQRIVGNETEVSFSGRFDADRFEGNGLMVDRRCVLVLVRAKPPG